MTAAQTPPENPPWPPYHLQDKQRRVKHTVRNLPGVELCCVDHLSLSQLAPGGHIWSQSALDALDVIYGATDKSIPEDLMANADLARINSDEVQSALNQTQRANKKYLHKKNPLVNIKALLKLDANELWCEQIEVY